MEIDSKYELFLEIKKNIEKNNRLYKLLSNLTNNYYSLDNNHRFKLIDHIFKKKPELKDCLTDINSNYIFFEDPFSNACLSGNIEMVRHIRKVNTNINIFIYNIGFLNACVSGNQKLVEYLLEIKPEILFLFKNEPIKYACRSGNLELITYLMIQFKNTGIIDDNLFVDLCKSGNIDTIDLLVDINEMELLIIRNSSILNFICCKGDIGMLKYLIGFLNNDIIYKIIDISLADDACKSGKKDILGFLINKNTGLIDSIKQSISTFFPKIFFPKSTGILDILYNINHELKITGPQRFYLSKICYEGDLEFFKRFYFLIEKSDFDLSFENDLCFRNACLSGNTKMVKYLLEINTKIDIRTNNDDSLVCACESGNIGLVLYLINKEPDMNLYNNDYICFHKAYKNGRKLVVNYMLSCNPHLVYHFKNIYHSVNRYFEYKISLIQKWWKTIIYNPYKPIGKKFIMNQIEWAW
jgi:hypothetical protein